MGTNRVLKVETDKTYGNWDWTYDGAYKEPRVKGKDKRRRNKHQRSIEKRMAKNEVNKIINESECNCYDVNFCDMACNK